MSLLFSKWDEITWVVLEQNASSNPDFKREPISSRVPHLSTCLPAIYRIVRPEKFRLSNRGAAPARPIQNGPPRKTVVTRQTSDDIRTDANPFFNTPLSKDTRDFPPRSGRLRAWDTESQRALSTAEPSSSVFRQIEIHTVEWRCRPIRHASDAPARRDPLGRQPDTPLCPRSYAGEQRSYNGIR